MSKGPWKRPKDSLPDSPLSSEAKTDADGFSKDKPTTRKARNIDPISRILKVEDENYFLKMRWAWFRKNEYGVDYALEVDRFYSSISLALDLENQDDELSTFKRKVLEAHSIRYVRLQDLLTIHDLAGLQ